MAAATTLESFRAVTGYVRPPGSHGCPPTEVAPGLWQAHFHDIDTAEKLRAVAPAVTVVINTGTDKCPAVDYGEGVELVLVEGLLDDPDARKKADAMPEGPAKVSAKAALPEFAPGECAGDAKKDFSRVNGIIDKATAAGGAVMIHCHASISRSVVFILAYFMHSRSVTAAEAAALLKREWAATWPNDTFVGQLLQYEAELAAARG